VPELLRMPEIAAATTSATLASWPVPVRERFSAQDVIATVETDKAVVDVEAEADGVILRTLVPEGTEVEVGTAIALLARADEQVDDVDAVLAQLGVASAGTPAPPEPAPEEELSDETDEVPVSSNGHGRRFASPLARRLAAQAGLMLTDLVGTGPGGRIIRRDVEAALAQRVAPEEADVHDASPAATPVPQAVPAPVAVREPEPAPGAEAAAGWTDQPAGRMRRAVAKRLTESKTTAPHFYLRGSARVDELLRLRAELNDGAEVAVSVTDLVVKAVARAHRIVPEMNVIWTGDAVRSFAGVDVAVAVATDGGLVTPVLRGVETRSVTDVARATQDLAGRARSGRLQQSELDGGSITVSNLGMYGVEEFAAILNPPQAAILAVGAARPEPVVVDGRVEPATVLRVTLSVDHRPVDGVIAARWMTAFVSLLERPVRILA
jgi:pyruvate dehydrogenase E2 component (dihydrolipoamide acetyltransferase)